MPIVEKIICDCGCDTEITSGIYTTGVFNVFQVDEEGVRQDTVIAKEKARFFVDLDHLKTLLDSIQAEIAAGGGGG